MPKNLSLSLTIAKDEINDKLKEVRDSAGQAKEALEKAEDSIRGIADDMSTAAEAGEKLQEALTDIGQSSGSAKVGTSQLDSELRDITASSSTVSVQLDEVSRKAIKAGSRSLITADAIDQLEEQMQEATNAIQKLTASLSAQSGAAAASVGPNMAAANAIDEMGDEAAEARNKMAGAASMSELLSLKSSALSINVGAFTIALRNLTTQVPLLVASLGNLATAFTGVAGAIGAVGVGGFGVALGGAVAQVEEMTGEMATMEEKFQAMQAIGKEFTSMLREGIEPLVEMEGSAELFKSLLEGVATTVRAFSQSIADSYEEGPLREAINTLSSAWMDSITDIGEAFEYMVRRLESAGLFDVFASGIEQLDEFIVFVTTVVEDMMAILGGINEDDALNTFIVELMELGRQIASGLAPLMNTFLEIVGSVAQEITSLGDSTIAATVQIVALGLAMNKLVGIIGTIAQPFALFAGHLGDVVDKSNSVTEAVTRMSGRLINGLSTISTGFDRVSQAIATAMPMMNPDQNNLQRLATSMNNSGGPISRLTDGISGLGNRLSITSGSLSGFSSVLTSSGDSAGFFARKITNLRSSLSQLVATQSMAGTAMSLYWEGLPGSTPDLDEGDILSARQVNEALPSTVANVGRYIDTDFDETELTGLDAIRQRLVNFRGRFINALQGINATAFSDGPVAAIKQAGGIIKRNADNMFEEISRTLLTGFSSLTLNTGGFVDSIKQRAQGMASAFDDSMESTNALTMSLSRLSFSSFRQSLSSITPSINITQSSINNLIGKLELISASNARAALSFSGLSNAISYLTPSIVSAALSLETYDKALENAAESGGKLGIAAGGLRTSLHGAADATQDAKRKLIRFAGTEVLAADNSEEFADEMIKLGKSANISKGQLQELKDEVNDLSTGSIVAGMSITDLEDELEDLGIDSTIARSRIEEMGDAMTTTSVKATVLSGASRTLAFSISSVSAALTTLILTLTGLVTVFVSILAIIGIASAALLKLGSSGKDADDIINGLKETLTEVGDAALPLVVELGNTVIDIFNSILYPIKALVEGFEDIAVRLGFISESTGEATSKMERFESLMAGLTDIVDAVGDAFRQLSGAVTRSITIMLDKLEEFLVDIKFGEKVRGYISFLKDFYNDAIPELADALDKYLNKTIEKTQYLLSELADAISNVMDAFIGAFNLEGLSFDDLMSGLKDFGDYLISLIDPMVNLLLSLGNAFAKLADIIIFLGEGLLVGLAVILGGIVDLAEAFLTGLFGVSGDDMAGGFMDAMGMMAGAVRPVLNALAGIIDVMVIMADVVMAVLGPIGAALIGMFEAIVDFLIPSIRAIGELIRYVFSNIITATAGTIDFIVRLVGTIIDMLVLFASLKPKEAIEELGEFTINTLQGIIDFAVNAFSRLGEIIGDAFLSALDEMIEALLSIPGALVGMFGKITEGIGKAIADAWDDTIGGKTIIPKLGAGPIGNALDVELGPVEIPNISSDSTSVDTNQQAGNLGQLGRLTNNRSTGDGSGDGGLDKYMPPENEGDEQDIFDSVDTVGGLTSAGKKALFGGPAPGVEFNEGDTMNQYNQDISADPEDKAQISRIAKDAMEEANSFARRQQGGQ